MIKSDSVGKLFQALATAQAAFGPVLREKENPGFKRDNKPSKYADLDAAIKATQPALIQNGLVISQFPISTDTRVGVLTILGHTSGEFIGQEYTLPIFKQDAQTGVGGITYARRAARLAVIDVAAEDDDGNTAAGRKVEEWQEPSAETVRKVIAQTAEDRAEISEPVSASPQIGIQGVPLPDEAQLQKYTDRLRALREKLQTEGKLKPSAGLSAPRKVLNYVLKATGSDDLKKISIVQWDVFMSYAEKMDPLQLVTLINDKGGK
jgi:hypothetical protein